MKRSEMLNIIWEAINELEDADHILKRIEAAGMIPPVTFKSSASAGDYSTADTISLNEWEPENE